MQIAIIGGGNVGSALAQGLKGCGHQVTFGLRDPAKPEAQAMAQASGAAIADLAAAAAGADIIILALPWAAAPSAIASLGDVTGKTVIDCMNPLGMMDGKLRLLIGHTSSGGETVSDWLPGAHVVKTLNQVGAEIMAGARGMAQPPAMFMAGNDADAKARVAQLLTDLGFAPLDAGDITKARLLEPLGMVWINQAILRGKGRNWAFTITNQGV